MNDKKKLTRYIGVNIINATEMTRGDYNIFRGWPIPENEDPNDEGYLVVYPNGYESWSPKKQFDEAHRQIDHMNFGLAIEAIKKGLKVARYGWNGPNQYLQLEKGRDYEFSKMLQHIVIKTVQNNFVPWLASQTDMLSDDWFIIE